MNGIPTTEGCFAISEEEKDESLASILEQLAKDARGGKVRAFILCSVTLDSPSAPARVVALNTAERGLTMAEALTTMKVIGEQLNAFAERAPAAILATLAASCDCESCRKARS